jgi:hypothetical protein
MIDKFDFENEIGFDCALRCTLMFRAAGLASAKGLCQPEGVLVNHSPFSAQATCNQTGQV